MAETIVRTYGRGSFLAFLSPLLAFFMARQGLHGWEQNASEAMARDVQAMERRGYRVASAEEYTLPVLGIAWFRVEYEASGSRPGVESSGGGPLSG